MTREHAAGAAQVIYHASAIEAEDRAWHALLRLQVVTAMSTAMRQDEDTEHLSAHALLGAPDPSVSVGRSFGPTHTRRSAALARIRANDLGAPIVHERTTQRSTPKVSPLDVSPRCMLTDFPTPTCAHCLGHNLGDED